jgi:hypothetical protein
MPDPREAYNKKWRKEHPDLVRLQNRRNYVKRADKARAYARKYASENRDKCLAGMKRWAAANREHRIAYRKKWYAVNREDQIRKHKETTRLRKLKVLEHYGKDCVCCGESNWECLTIDHMNGGGTKHREETKRFGTGFYMWLIKNNFPEGYQTLCWNCNCSRGQYGYCPHQKR